MFARVRGITVASVLASLLSACANDDTPPRLVGTLERDRIEIIAESAEPIVTLGVREGEHVTEGQELLRQDVALATARAAQVDAQVQQARHRLTELEKGARVEEIDQAR